MSILVDKNTKVITQGMTGATGTFHTEQALAYGTQMVGGVTPARAGRRTSGCPSYDTVAEARRDRCDGERVSTCRRPLLRIRTSRHRCPRSSWIVAITEGIPVLTWSRQARAARDPIRLIGPELPRRADAERVQDRHHAGSIFSKGSVGRVSARAR
jgi:succinyl-CoA synthetase alpha subunit